MKKRAIYNIGQKNFNTFKEMKAFVWYNSHTDEEIQGFEIAQLPHFQIYQDNILQSDRV